MFKNKTLPLSGVLIQDKSLYWMVTMEYTSVVCLKSGLACVAIFGESSDFLEKSFFAKFQKSGFLENHCISYSLYHKV